MGVAIKSCLPQIVANVIILSDPRLVPPSDISWSRSIMLKRNKILIYVNSWPSLFLQNKLDPRHLFPPLYHCEGSTVKSPNSCVKFEYIIEHQGRAENSQKKTSSGHGDCWYMVYSSSKSGDSLPPSPPSPSELLLDVCVTYFITLRDSQLKRLQIINRTIKKGM